MPVQVEYYVRKKRPKAKLITLKPDTYGYMQAIYWRDLAVAAGQLK